MMISGRKECLVVAALMLFGGCATAPSTQVLDTSALVWPAPPQAARIAYLHEIRSPSDLNIGKGFFTRIAEAIKGSEPREISQPYGMVSSGSGKLYIVDNAYQAIHVLDTRKGNYARFPERPPDDFKNPVNLALGSGNRIFVSDSVSGLVHVFDNQKFAHLGSFGQELLVRPTGLAVNPVTDELLVVDTKRSQIAVFDEPTLQFKRFVGGEPKSDGGEAEISFHYPTNIAVGADGRVLISDSLNFRVQVLDSTLHNSTEFGAPGNEPGYFSRPKGLAVDSDGHVYVIDAIFDNVQIFSPDGELLLAFGGPGNTPGKFWLPNAIFIDSNDQIYVSDSFNQRIQVFQYLRDGREGM